jgi:hypothetical protein
MVVEMLEGNNINYNLCIRDLIADPDLLTDERRLGSQHLAVKTREELQLSTGLTLNLDNYENLSKCIIDSLKNITRIKVCTNKNKCEIIEYISRFKKGSKNFRKVFEQNRNAKVKCTGKTTIRTFFRLIGVDILPEPDLEVFNSLWTLQSIPNKIREFIYKFRNNKLGLNTRVSHFNNTVDRSCTFCKIIRTAENARNPAPQPNQVDLDPIPEETFKHLFYDCPVTNDVLSRLNVNLLNDLGLDTDQKKIYFFFTGKNPLDSRVKNFFLQTCSAVVMFSIWEKKLAKKLPSINNTLNDLYYTIENIRRSNGQIRNEMLELNYLHICRTWREESFARR